MAPSPPSIIVFGPTGNVAGIAAKTAQQHGAKVFLAMRDPSKSIPGLSSTEEREGGFERVQADLTKPETVLAAVKTSGAQRAFIYAAHGHGAETDPGMLNTIKAMKEGGVGFVVFLSSYTILERRLEDVPREDMIPYLHAKVEISLNEVFRNGKEEGLGYVALRMGGFATNVAMWSGEGIRKGEVRLWCPGAKFDCVTPEDMGEVAGIILADGMKEGGGEQGGNVVYLFGPQSLSQEEQIKIIGKALGKEIRVAENNEEQAVDAYKAAGIPEVFAKYLASKMAKTGGGIADTHKELWQQGVANVEKYTGHKATAFEPWVKANLVRFQ